MSDDVSFSKHYHLMVCIYIGEVRSCLDIKEKLNMNQDGEYDVQVGHTQVSIYCHNMTSPRPREFLTLHNQNLMDSYSEIFPRRLILPYKCPENKTEKEVCVDNQCVKSRTECNKHECIEERTDIAGFTVWNKISIDLHSMTIDRFDFTFSHQVYGQKVPFASAGDCFSIGKCPRGGFSVNLHSTGFMLDPAIQWISEGHFSTQEIVNKNVSKYANFKKS